MDLAVTPAAEVETEDVIVVAVGLKSTDHRPERIIESSSKIYRLEFRGRFVFYFLNKALSRQESNYLKMRETVSFSKQKKFMGPYRLNKAFHNVFFRYKEPIQ